jgi:hypothetical protein
MRHIEMRDGNRVVSEVVHIAGGRYSSRVHCRKGRSSMKLEFSPDPRALTGVIARNAMITSIVIVVRHKRVYISSN